MALTAHDEFWGHVAELRADPSAGDRLARLYVRRDQSGRLQVIRTYLERAVSREPHPDHRYEKVAVWATGMRAWAVDGPLQEGQPVRNLRADVIDTIALGAYRVARRGAGRCAVPTCCVEPITGQLSGAKLGTDHGGDYCSVCAQVLRRPRELEEAERALFNAVIPAVLGVPSRQRNRRIRRQAA